MAEESLIQSILTAYSFVDQRDNIAQYFKRLSDVVNYIKLLYAGQH